MTTTTRLAATGIAGILAVGATGCDQSAATPTAQPSTTASPSGNAAPPAPVPSVDAGDPQTPPATIEPGEIDGHASAEVPGQRVPLRPLLDSQDPKGGGPAIALRFLRALQHGDHAGAARQLFRLDRYLAGRDQQTLDRAMADVARNARLADAGECTRADRLNAEAAVVRCGRRTIVVHVTERMLPGVRISTAHPDGDIYPGPHTHAFTTVDPF